MDNLRKGKRLDTGGRGRPRKCGRNVSRSISEEEKKTSEKEDSGNDSVTLEDAIFIMVERLNEIHEIVGDIHLMLDSLSRLITGEREHEV